MQLMLQQAFTLALLFLSQQPFLTIASCPLGYGNEDQGSCYRIISDMTWSAAVSSCTKSGGWLATIENPAEDKFLLSSFTASQSQGTVWIGLSDSAAEGTWKWIRTGKVASYLNWNGKPDGGTKKNCAMINLTTAETTSGWKDSDCNLVMNGLCEINATAGLDPITLSNELHCVSGETEPPPLAMNDTCLYVTLMDEFGDGWSDCANFYYLVQIEDEDSNVIQSSLDCSCPMRVGCIHPADLSMNQLIYLTVSCNDTSYIPDHAWEIHWTAQIIQGGVQKEKYYGGYNSSMVFEYMPFNNWSYDLVLSENLWVVPEDCAEFPIADGHGIDFTEYLDSNLLCLGLGESLSQDFDLAEATLDLNFMRTSWYLTDPQKKLLYGYGKPLCNTSSSSDNNNYTQEIALEVGSLAYLKDGQYIFRSIGHDPNSERLWELCGWTIGSGHEFQFEIFEGNCSPDLIGHVCSQLSAIPTNQPTAHPTSSPTSEPTASPTSSPTEFPTSEPTAYPTSSPTLPMPTEPPTFSPSHVPSSLPTSHPTFRPSFSPSAGPSLLPSSLPTLPPTFQPVYAKSPTLTPTLRIANTPTKIPTLAPSFSPTISMHPTQTESPTTVPSFHPTIVPSSDPTSSPSFPPSSTPSVVPISPPSSAPTFLPTLAPTADPSFSPTSSPTSPTPAPVPKTPTWRPTLAPSRFPSLIPTLRPTTSPTKKSGGGIRFDATTPSPTGTSARTLNPAVFLMLNKYQIPTAAFESTEPPVTLPNSLHAAAARSLSPAHAVNSQKGKPHQVSKLQPTQNPALSFHDEIPTRNHRRGRS
jgi:hypothetical protein